MRVEATVEEAGAVKVSADSTYDLLLLRRRDRACGYPEAQQVGLIPAAKYEVQGDWFEDGEVEVFVDQKKYPGFFAWVIPRGDGMAKVGVAGFGINSFKTLDSFLQGRTSRILTQGRRADLRRRPGRRVRLRTDHTRRRVCGTGQAHDSRRAYSAPWPAGSIAGKVGRESIG